MKTSHVSLLAAVCLVTIAMAAEPGATPAPSSASPIPDVSQLHQKPGDAPANGVFASPPAASPSGSPVTHHRHHVVAAPSPTPTATPAKRKWWQRKSKMVRVLVRPSPSASPSASPRKMRQEEKAAPTASPTASAKAEPSASATATPEKRHEKKTEASPAPKATAAPSATPSATPRTLRHAEVTASPSPSATPSPKKASVWRRFFTRSHATKTPVSRSPSPSPSPAASPAIRKHRAQAEPAASISANAPGATPAAKPRKQAKAQPAATPANPAKPKATPKPTPQPTPSATPKPTPTATPVAEATPASKHKNKPGEMTTQVPFVPGPNEQQPAAPAVRTKSPVEAEAEETTHFLAAKAKALQDEHVKVLQAKADEATGEDVKDASRRYYKALYGRMREIDPSLGDRIDRTEAAALRRVEKEDQ